MALRGTRRATEPAVVVDMLEAWRARILRTCCLASGAALLMGPVVFWLTTGTPLPALPSIWSIALAILALALLGGDRFVRRRSVAYLLLLAAAVGILDFEMGWAPGIVGLSCFLVAAFGLLLSPRVGYGFLALQGLALCLGGEAMRRGVFHVEDDFLDAAQASNWLRITLVVVMLGLALWTLLRSVAALVDSSYASAGVSLAMAEHQLAVSRSMRQARIEAERALRGPQKLQALAQLAGGLAHLINNELTVVAGALHDLDHDSSPSTRRDVATRIEHAVERAGATIRQMMVFSRRDEPAAQELDLVAEVRRIVDELRPTFGSDVALTIQGNEGHRLHIEPTRLRLLLLNLLLNAADALPGGGRVQISVCAEPSRARGVGVSLVVEDTGHGMTSEVLARACDTFFTTRSRTRHAGLGLSVAASIAEQSGGLLTIESAPGIGTRVRIRWPDAGTSAAPRDDAIALLHAAQLTPMHAVPVVEAEETFPIVVDDDRWKNETAARLARIGALLTAAVIAGVFWFSPGTPNGFFLAMGSALAAELAAGWLTRLRGPVRLALLFAPVAFATGLTLSWFTFKAGAIIGGMSIILVWATMLGPWWAGLSVLAWFMLNLIVGGYLHVTGMVATDPTLTSMSVPANWLRVAISLSAVQAGMLASIDLIVRRAAQGLALMSDAQRRAVHAQRQEEAEGARALLLEQEATRVERMSVTGVAAGAVAHDLNNALQALSLGGLLGRESLTPKQVASIARDVRSAANYCAALVVLIGQDPSVPTEPHEAIDVSATLEHAKDLLPAFVGHGVTTQISIEPGCWANISASDLQRIVLNLTANARDAMAGTGTLRVTLRRDADQISLEVSDSGHGMDEAVRARLFEPFFTTKPSGKGTGLGLHAVARIVEQTRGTIACESTQGVGTIFTLRWPHAESDDPPASARIGSSDPQARGTILVAEDQPLVRRVIVDALRAMGYDVLEAADGDAALALAERDATWTALCIDGVMPGRPTADVIDAFALRHPHCPVLLCSGHLPEELARRGLRRERVQLISKPFSPTDLQRALTSALRGSA